ncbi:nitronate monooxygenase family protein [Alicyclobacillus sp. SP_1]|uniref:NAD(P)H-dependent flavin oxidoreductase n=1 Tax=Alicyclobacillus sp. SP_1 TaxID=2942475 RepID=UPI002157443A|nr:nitronate monooxygenase [Alicyclobacillus sp. SP_1]
MLKTKFTKLANIRYPIIQAGMAGGITTPELVAAVSNAGGLGTVGAGYMNRDQLRGVIRAVKRLTDRPFGVNLFAPQEVTFVVEDVQRMNHYLDDVRESLGIEPSPQIEKYAESFDDQIQVVLEEHVPVFSFTFGIPSSAVLKELKYQETIVIGTATTVKEAMELDEVGVDAVVVQGSEAGGHRGTFRTDASHALIGTMSLVPQVVDHVSIPVIASGGIMDGRGIIASLALGASAVQMGTAFIACPESGAHKLYKEKVLESHEDSTEITSAYSGKLARGIHTKFMQGMRSYPGEMPSYPVQNALTRDIRLAAAKRGDPEYMSLWAGQGLRMATNRQADAIIQECVQQALNALGNIGSSGKEI